MRGRVCRVSWKMRTAGPSWRTDQGRPCCCAIASRWGWKWWTKASEASAKKVNMSVCRRSDMDRYTTTSATANTFNSSRRWRLGFTEAPKRPDSGKVECKSVDYEGAIPQNSPFMLHVGDDSFRSSSLAAHLWCVLSQFMKICQTDWCPKPIG